MSSAALLRRITAACATETAPPAAWCGGTTSPSMHLERVRKHTAVEFSVWGPRKRKEFHLQHNIEMHHISVYRVMYMTATFITFL